MKVVNRVAAAFLVVLVIFSAGSIYITARNYQSGTNAAANVELALHRLEYQNDGTPKIRITFRLNNTSPLGIQIEDVHFSTYLNGHFMGSNYDAFAERTLGGSEEVLLDFVIALRPFYLQHIEEARQEGEFEWFLRGQANLRLPFDQHKFALHIREAWSGSGEQ